MTSINICKKVTSANESIKLEYKGISTKDNIDLDKINTLLEDFTKNHRHNCMEENITIVRTMMRDFEEKLLIISYQNKSGSEIVKYDNNNLILYKNNNNEVNCTDGFKIKYEPTSGIKLNYNNHNIDLAKYSSIRPVSEEITKILEKIYSLINAKAITLDNYDKALIGIYKLFYNETPDFSSKEINVKIQTMMFILAEFGIGLYEFKIYKKERIPLSLELQQKINKLYPLGEVDDINVKISKETKKIISIVGEYIRNTIPNEQSKNEALIKISKVIYAKKYLLSYDCTIKEISNYTGYTFDEVNSSLKLVKKVKNEIDKKVE